MMRRCKRNIAWILGISAIALIFSGFTYTDKDSGCEVVSDLMLCRTHVMQRAMFGENFSGEYIFEALSDIERHPLLEEDCEAFKLCADSDFDRVINMQVDSVSRTARKSNIEFYDVSVTWYMEGNDGHYVCGSEYEVRTITINGETKLYDITDKSE